MSFNHRKMTYALFTLQIMHVILLLKNDICTIHIANNACHSINVKMTYALFPLEIMHVILPL